MNSKATLPPGQYEAAEFPRFGLSGFANRFPKQLNEIELQLGGDVEEAVLISKELEGLDRVELVADFHCVTTWTYRSVRWSGFRFADFFERIVVPRSRPLKDALFVVLRGQDGYRTGLPLADLMADDVLLADSMNGAALTIEHGAPLRLIAPQHYGYKSPKHLNRIEFRTTAESYRPAGFRFMEHPRARVALEERGKTVPGPILRYLYRPLVAPTVWQFRRAMQKYRRERG